MICVGIWTWGYRVIETMASKITELTSVRGFTVEFSAASVILVASMMGLPVSTTHAAVGAFVGVGLGEGAAGAARFEDLGAYHGVLGGNRSRGRGNVRNHLCGIDSIDQMNSIGW